jgi:hypothetical protein
LRISAACGTPLRSAVSAISFAEGIVLAIGCDGKEAGIAVRFREGMGFAVAGMLTALRNGACFRVGIGLAIGEGAALAAAAARLFDGIGFAVACTCSELRNGTCFPAGIGSAIRGEGIEPAAAARLRGDDGFVIARGGIERREGACLSADIERPPCSPRDHRSAVRTWEFNEIRPAGHDTYAVSEASSDFDSNDYGGYEHEFARMLSGQYTRLHCESKKADRNTFARLPRFHQCDSCRRAWRIPSVALSFELVLSADEICVLGTSRASC